MATVTFVDKHKKEKTYFGDIYFEEIKVNDQVSVINCFFEHPFGPSGPEGPSGPSTHHRIAYFSIPPEQFETFLFQTFSFSFFSSIKKQDPYNAIGPFPNKEKKEKEKKEKEKIVIEDGKDGVVDLLFF